MSGHNHATKVRALLDKLDTHSPGEQDAEIVQDVHELTVDAREMQKNAQYLPGSAWKGTGMGEMSAGSSFTKHHSLSDSSYAVGLRFPCFRFPYPKSEGEGDGGTTTESNTFKVDESFEMRKGAAVYNGNIKGTFTAQSSLSKADSDDCKTATLDKDAVQGDLRRYLRKTEALEKSLSPSGATRSISIGGRNFTKGLTALYEDACEIRQMAQQTSKTTDDWSNKSYDPFGDGCIIIDEEKSQKWDIDGVSTTVDLTLSVPLEFLSAGQRTKGNLKKYDSTWDSTATVDGQPYHCSLSIIDGAMEFTVIRPK